MATLQYPPPLLLSRQQEKAELQYLSDRMQTYIGKVRKIREDANKEDSSALLNSIRLLEDEVTTIKGMYEKEMSNLRRQVEDQNAGRTQAETQAHRNGEFARDLQDRLSIENQRARALMSEMDGVHKLSAHKDMELQHAKAQNEELIRKVRELEDDLATLRRNNEETQRNLDRETVGRQEAQDKQNVLQNKLAFQEQVHAEESTDYKNRLDDDANRIMQLEAKVRELAKPDNTLHEALARLRESSQRELQRYKEESEATFHLNIQELKNQMDRDTENIHQMSETNKRLQKEIENLNHDLQQAHSKLDSSDKYNKNLLDALNDERERNSAHIRALENKLRELQDSLVQKMHEITIATDAKQPIRAELEALKCMLEEEERKLHNVPSTSFPRPCVLPPARPPISPRRPQSVGIPLNKSFHTVKTSRDVRPSSVPPTMGQGRDYFDSIFRDLNKSGTIYPRLHPKSALPLPGRMPPMSHDFTTATASATGDLKILEVNEDGRFVRLFNTAANRDVEIGGYMIQQNVGGHPVAVYRFPPRTTFRSGGVITIWSASSLAHHNPPTDFLWREQHKWGTGPECTTIFCRPNGQAIAWTTAAHRFSKTARSYEAKEKDSEEEVEEGVSNPHPEFEVEIDGKPVTVLKREKQGPPSLSPAKHPHGQFIQDDTHPGAGEPRAKTLGNDGSSLMRQSRSQNSNPLPDLAPSELYAGHGISATRTGSASLKKSSRASSAGSQGSIRYTGNPNPFSPPHQQHSASINMIGSQHQVNFKAPMPRPHAISSW